MDSDVNISPNPTAQASAHGGIVNLPVHSRAAGANDGVFAQVSNNPFFTAVSL